MPSLSVARRATCRCSCCGEARWSHWPESAQGKPSPLAYDSSDKRRVPAYTDRIFFRGSGPARSQVQAPMAPAQPCRQEVIRLATQVSLTLSRRVVQVHSCLLTTYRSRKLMRCVQVVSQDWCQPCTKCLACR